MKFIVSGLLMLGLFTSYGQTPQITNGAGFDLSSPIFFSTTSIGEVLVTTLTGHSATVTQGFLQPLRYNPCSEITISFYPNPTVGEVTIEAMGCEAKIESMEFYNSWGQLLTVIGRPENNKIDLGNLSPGLYFINVLLTQGSSQLVKIIKTSN
jgi:hypothetical protein